MVGIRRLWSTSLGCVLAVLAITSPAMAELELNDRLPCPHGACVPNRMTFGYYPTRWRRWPVIVESPASAEQEAAAGGGLSETSEPPATAEDEVRSPFERLPRATTPEPEPGAEIAPPGAEPGPPPEEGEGDQPGQPPPPGAQPGRRIFQPPRGNPLPTPRRPIEDGAGILDAPTDSPPVGQPRRLPSTQARPVSYANPALGAPRSLGQGATSATHASVGRLPSREDTAKQSARSSATNPLRSAKPDSTRPAAPPDEAAPAGEGPQITPTAAWLEERDTAPAVPKARTGAWRRNPLRAG